MTLVARTARRTREIVLALSAAGAVLGGWGSEALGAPIWTGSWLGGSLTSSGNPYTSEGRTLTLGAASEPYIDPHRYATFSPTARLSFPGGEATIAIPEIVSIDGIDAFIYSAPFFVDPVQNWAPPITPLEGFSNFGLSPESREVPFRALVLPRLPGGSGTEVGSSLTDFDIPLSETFGVERPAARVGSDGIVITFRYEVYIDGAWRALRDVMDERVFLPDGTPNPALGHGYLYDLWQESLGTAGEGFHFARWASWYTHALPVSIQGPGTLFRALVPGPDDPPPGVPEPLSGASVLVGAGSAAYLLRARGYGRVRS